MNEPHDIPDLQSWADSVQAAVNAIRTAGATSQTLLIPGSSYSSAQTLPTEAGPYLLKVTDPAGGTSKLIFDGKQYLISPRKRPNAEYVVKCTSTSTAITPAPTLVSILIIFSQIYPLITLQDCVTDNVSVFQTLVQWLEQNGRQALLSETGGGNTASCETELVLQHIR